MVPRIASRNSRAAAVALLAALVLAPAAVEATGPRVDLTRIPLSFEENRGQVPSPVKFVSRGPGYAVYLTPSEAVLAVARPGTARGASRVPGAARRNPPVVDVLRIALAGGNPRAEAVGLDNLPGRVNYFRGKDPARWRAGVRTYAKVRYRDVYPGVDVVYYGKHGALEYDLVVAPDADPRVIALTFDDARRIELDPSGDLMLHLAGGAVRQLKPVVHQEVDGVRRRVAARYTVEGRRVGVHVAAYDKSRPLVIDPVVLYGTYLGGSDLSEGLAIAVDASGSVYVAGDSVAVDFQLVGPIQPALAGNYDAIVMKLAPDAATLQYATYLGGAQDDSASAIAVDAAGNAYVGGFTSSADFPVTLGALQATNHGGFADGFVVKLNPAGTALLYSTYLGGGGDDQIFGLRVDGAGRVVVAGSTDSTDFPVVSALQGTSGGGFDAFVARIDAAGSALLGSTYLGGAGDDGVLGMAMDATGAVYLTGYTSSLLDFPATAGGLQRVYGGGDFDAFVAKLDARLSTLVYSTYLGGSGQDFAWAVAVDGSGNAFVTGWTISTDFPTVSALQPVKAGDYDAFVAKLNPAGSALVYSTYLGGSSFDSGLAIGVDSGGDAVVAGSTFSPDFPTVAPITAAPGGIWVSRLGPAGAPLLYSTFLGGGGDAWATGIAVASDGVAYVTGRVDLGLPATPGVVQPLPAGSVGNITAFVVKLDPLTVANPGDQTNVATAPISPLSIVASGRVGATLTYSAGGLPPGLTINPATGVISGTISATSVGSHAVTITVFDGALSVSTTFTWVVLDPLTVTNPGNQTGREGGTFSLQIVGTDPDGDTLTYSQTGLPTDLTLNPTTGLISGTPQLGTAGSHLVTVTIADGHISVSTGFTLTVNSDQQPLLQPIPNQTVFVGQLLTFSLSATDPDGDPVTYSFTVTPPTPPGPSPSLNATTGVFAWTPASAQIGSYTVTFTATDPLGLSSSQTATLTVTTNRPPVCTAAVPSVGQIWPPNHRRVNITILGVTDPDGDPVTITITRILQDEPTGSAPNGGGIGTSTAWVLADRNGNGDGRVYQIFFTVSDGKGGTCQGSAKVGVSHDQGRGPAIDSGVRYDSTVASGRERDRDPERSDDDADHDRKDDGGRRH